MRYHSCVLIISFFFLLLSCVLFSFYFPLFHSTHDPPETLAVLVTPGVDDDFSRAKKKPCLDDRDKNPPLDKDRDTMPGLEE